MSTTLIFDIETDGLLPTLTKIHCINIYNIEKKEHLRFDAESLPISQGIIYLELADCIIGHNIIGFDIPAIKKLYPEFKPKAYLDTLVWARLAYSDIKQADYGRVSKGQMPGKLTGSHSLEAYGYRMGVHKSDFGKEAEQHGGDTKWDFWTPEMSDYCEQDVKVNVALYEKLLLKVVPAESLQLEHDVARIIARQMSVGILFDEKKAQALFCILTQKKDDLLRELQLVFEPWWAKDGKEFTPKKDNKKSGYRAGCPMSKIKLLEFNPGSRAHIEYQLKKLYSWEPDEFTKSGEPKLDDEVISALPYPKAKPLGEYLTVVKRLSQLSEGDAAWLKAVEPDGRIYGYVNTCGAGTGRMTHSHPNLAQVPRVGNPYGEECRELFIARPGYKFMGCDAASLELRCLSHYMAVWDGGAYGRASVSGRKEDGTDVHTINQKAIGAATRDDGKTWFYAYIYGAGSPKLGKILLNGKPGNAGKLGGSSKSSFKKNLPALGKLGDKVQEAVKAKGFLKGIDGRTVLIRSPHSALNFLLQGAGAIVMKKALVILDESFIAAGYTNSDSGNDYDYEFVLNVHDEWQVECKADLADAMGRLAVQAIVKAGEYYNFRCPLDGEYAIGNNWKETH